MRSKLRVLCATLALCASAPAALAQTAPEPPPPEAAPADPCAVAPGDASSSETLTGQLAECNGVLTPPDDTATGIQAPVPDPDPGTTPVIPPEEGPGAPDAT